MMEKEKKSEQSAARGEAGELASSSTTLPLASTPADSGNTPAAVVDGEGVGGGGLSSSAALGLMEKVRLMLAAGRAK